MTAASRTSKPAALDDPQCLVHASSVRGLADLDAANKA